MRKKYKTKFPVARIKKIMQMDEDVGKMSQATPVLISKALELFMQSIVEDVAKQARVCKSKRVSPTHLKRCIETTECYDFLKDIIENVKDDGDGGGPEESKRKIQELEQKGNGGSNNNSSSGEPALPPPPQQQQQQQQVPMQQPQPHYPAGPSGGGGAPISNLLNAQTPPNPNFAAVPGVGNPPVVYQPQPYPQQQQQFMMAQQYQQPYPGSGVPHPQQQQYSLPMQQYPPPQAQHPAGGIPQNYPVQAAISPPAATPPAPTEIYTRSGRLSRQVRRD
ncbi:hypothetical protein H4219_004966 [Mycoemilia scoparia]|uniref:Transcription factor CBF/NF-Y/archaeal histone domain-containing protein n=1 Tax=Mycoemilia scoparia TaxID=417184 RepID=A0A9W7ZWG4_9FUNG|nr:hypothetical protein H4219_004966 [Mycoemilia scoparia]